jgi:hypothetical protein
LLAADPTSGMHRDLRRAGVADLCFRLDVAGARPSTASVLARRRSVRGRPAPRNRRRIALGGVGARACSRSRLLRRTVPVGGRTVSIQPRTATGHRPASRLRGGSARRLDRGGRADRDSRPKRQAELSVPYVIWAAKRRAERLPRSAPLAVPGAERAARERAQPACAVQQRPGGAGRRRSAPPRQTIRRPLAEVSSMRGRWTARSSSGTLPRPDSRSCGPGANVRQPAQPR